MNSNCRIVALMVVWLLLGLQWMLFTHELGHLVAAKICRARVTYLDLHPLGISSMLFESPSCRSLILWSGFLLGSLFPFVLVSAWNIGLGGLGIFLQAWAWFCLLANGLYLLVGATESLSDSGLLVAAGWPGWTLTLAGAGLAALGYRGLSRRMQMDWNRQQLNSIRWTGIGCWVVVLVNWLAIQYGIARLLAVP
ncbi:MAG: hypothetical protein VX768_09465 [Planctomycetota bacterium]|nr:hypothetical protein [Planctomycetota bacterium]